MADWDLLVPGIGLTIIGMVAVGLSLAGIAKTFMEGMHAVGALTMFMGMIFLTAGMLKGGIPTSNSAKAAAAIILGLMIAFGAYVAGVSTVPSIPLFIGVLLLIVIPSMVIAYAAHRESKHIKAISVLFVSMSAVGMIAFITFSAVAPHPIEAGEEKKVEEVERPVIPEGPKVEIKILKGSSIQGNPAYDPPITSVEQGTIIVWNNEDNVAHTVTSGSGFNDPNFMKLFDSQAIGANEKFVLDTGKLEVGDYDYFCTFHPYMVGKFSVTKSATEEKSVTVKILQGAQQPSCADNNLCYSPAEIRVTPGTTVRWVNEDNALHTVTGTSDPKDASKWGDITIAGEKFDSGFSSLGPKGEWSFTFKEKGEYQYVCSLHSWMTGRVIVSEE